MAARLARVLTVAAKPARTESLRLRELLGRMQALESQIHTPMDGSRDGGLYVQYGCGFSAPASWRNFDASPTLRFERLPIVGRLSVKNERRFPSNVEYGDIVKGLPLPAGSCAAIYASHVLEHLALEDFQVALKHTYELLQPKGVFRLVVPDLEVLARQYLDSSDPAAAKDFMKASCLGVEQRSRNVGGFSDLAGEIVSTFDVDMKSLKHELEATGFVSGNVADLDDPIFMR